MIWSLIQMIFKGVKVYDEVTFSAFLVLMENARVKAQGFV